MIKAPPFDWIKSLPVQVGQWFAELVSQVNTALTNIASALSSISTISSAIAGMPAFSTQNIPATRVCGASYHNTTGRPMIVMATLLSNSGWVYPTAYTDANLTPTTLVGLGSTQAGASYACLTFVVKPGNYYMVTGNATVSAWTEWY